MRVAWASEFSWLDYHSLLKSNAEVKQQSSGVIWNNQQQFLINMGKVIFCMTHIWVFYEAEEKLICWKLHFQLALFESFYCALSQAI